MLKTAVIQQTTIYFFSFPEGNNTIFPKKLPPIKLNKKPRSKIRITIGDSTYSLPPIILIISSDKIDAPT